MKKKLLSVLLAGTMLLSMGVNVFAEETAKDSNVNEDGTVNNPEDVKVDKNKLVMWSLFTGGDGEYMSKIIDDYNAGSPTKQVQPITLVWADYYTKLQTAVAADKGPDIGLSHASKLAELVDQGVVEPLDDYLDELGVDLSSMYSENSLDAVTFDGEIYAIPLDTHAEVFYYNTDILEKAGIELNSDGKLDIKSEDQFMDMLDKVKAVMGDGESPISLPNTGDDPYRVWWTIGFSMMLYISALQDVDLGLYEASAIDGANARQQLFKITLPLLKPTTYLVILLQLIACFKVFGQIQLITNGGPAGSTKPLIQYIYEAAFQKNKLGYAAAMSYVLFGILLVLSLAQMLIQKRGGDR